MCQIEDKDTDDKVTILNSFSLKSIKNLKSNLKLACYMFE